MPSLLAVLGLNMGGFMTNLGKAKKEASEAGKEIASSLGEHVGDKLKEMVSMVAIEEMGRHVVEYAEQVGRMSSRLAMSTDAVQAWDYALKMSDTSLEANVGFFEKLVIARGKALKQDEEMIGSFERLGVSMRDLQTGRIEDIGLLIAKAFEEGDPQRLIGDLRTVGGKSAGELVAAFRGGLAEMIGEAKNAGVIISEATIGHLQEAADKGKLIWMQFVAGVAPAVSYLADTFKNLWHDGNVAMRGVVGFMTGGASGARDLMKEYDEEAKAQDKHIKEMEERKKKVGGMSLAEQEGAKERAEEIKHADRILRLKEELLRAQQEGTLKALTGEDKLAEMQRQRNQLAMIAADTVNASEEGRLQAMVDMTKLDGDIANELRREEKRKPEHSVNHLQKIGAYAAAPSIESTALRVHERNEGHLREIKTLVANMSRGNSRGVQF